VFKIGNAIANAFVEPQFDELPPVLETRNLPVGSTHVLLDVKASSF